MPRIGLVSPKAVTAVLDQGGDERLTVTYKPQAIVSVQQAVKEVDESQDTQETRNVLAQQLSGCLVSWDATGPLPDEDLTGFVKAKAGSIVVADAPIPLDPDTLSWLGVPVLKGLIMAIVEHSGDYPKATQNGSQPPPSTPVTTSTN